MIGKSDELFSAEKKPIIERVKSMYGDDVEVLVSLFNRSSFVLIIVKKITLLIECPIKRIIS